MSEMYDYLFKLLLIGDSGVGKTCLLLRYTEENQKTAFSQCFIPTIGIDFKIRTIEIDDKKIKLQIWDTAGQERFRTITTSYYRGALGIMMVYSVADLHSFRNIEKWSRAIQDNAGSGVEKMIIGNKADMEAERVVSTAKGEELALEYGLRFMETSAKTGQNVEDAFLFLAQDIKARIDRHESGSKKGRKSVVLKSDSIRPRSSWVTKCSIL